MAQEFLAPGGSARSHQASVIIKYIKMTADEVNSGVKLMYRVQHIVPALGRDDVPAEQVLIDPCCL